MSDRMFGSYECQGVGRGTAFVVCDTLPCTVFGPTCDGLDTLLTDYALPELQVTAITAGLQAIAWLRSVGAAGYGLYCTARCRLKHCR